MNELVARDYEKVGEFPVGEFVDADGKPLLYLRVWARQTKARRGG
jgi:hypothetical protein